MAADLGGESAEVHAAAQGVLSFWFEALTASQHFAKDPGLDRVIAHRFGRLREEILRTAAEGWRDRPEALLAAVIVLDQFSRNIYRDRPEAYAADPLAAELALLAMRRGWDIATPPARRMFIYMPLMHAEDAELQRRSVELFATLGMEEPLRFAREHAEVIDWFGRFPSRNKALSRKSTAEEEAYLSQPGAGW